MPADFEVGIQFHLPTFRDVSLTDFIGIGKEAQAGGVQQLWVTDNLQSRNAFVVLAALAGNIPLKLGTAVTVQYFRNPIDVADSVATITELMDGREFSLGIARGNRGTPNLVNVVKPVGVLRETAQSIKRLLAGDSVQFKDYPAIAAYFNIVPERSFKLHFSPKSPVRTYCGGNGPLALEIGGACMDGVLFGGTFQSVARSGHMGELMAVADQAAQAAGRTEPLRRVAEIKLSVAADGRKARDFVRRSAGTRVLSLRERGYSDDDYRTLGVDPADIDRLAAVEAAGGNVGDRLDLVTEAMIDAIFVAGDPAQCRAKMTEVAAMAREHGFGQLMFSELGPDVREGLRLLCDKVL